MGEGREPVRTCIGCRKKKNKKELLRIVRTKDGQILLDRRGCLDGRGAYVCDDEACMERIIKTHALERTFRMKTGEESYIHLEEQFVKRNTD